MSSAVAKQMKGEGKQREKEGWRGRQGWMGMDVEEEDAFTRVDACTARRYTSLTLRNLRMPRFREPRP